MVHRLIVRPSRPLPYWGHTFLSLLLVTPETRAGGTRSPLTPPPRTLVRRPAWWPGFGLGSQACWARSGVSGGDSRATSSGTWEGPRGLHGPHTHSAD